MYRLKKDKNDIDDFFFKKFLNHPILSSDQEQELLRKYKDEGSIEARNELVRHNLRYLVTKASRIVRNMYGNNGNDAIYDALCAGVIQLIDAANGHNLEVSKASNNGEPVRFLTYGGKFVRVRMQRELWLSGRRSQLSPKTPDKYFKYMGALRRLESSGVEPTLEEIAKKTKLSLKTLESMSKFDRRRNFSLDSKMDDESESEAKDLIPNITVSNEDYTNREFLMKYVGRLNPQEKKVIELRYLQGQLRPHTQVSIMIGRSEKTVRNIEKKAIGHLKKIINKKFF